MKNIPEADAKHVKHKVFKLAFNIEGGGEICGINGTIRPRDVGRIVRFMHIDKSDVVLDVGSGTGLACLNIANEACCQVIGMEWLESLHEKTVHAHNLMHTLHERDLHTEDQTYYAPPIIPIGGKIQGDFRLNGMEVCKYVTAMYSFWDSNLELYDCDSVKKKKGGLGIVETFFKSPTVKCVALIAHKRINDEARHTLFHLIRDTKQSDDETWAYMQQHFELKDMTNKDSGRTNSAHPEEVVSVNMIGGGTMKCLVIRRKGIVEEPLPIGGLIKKLGLREIPKLDILQKSPENQTPLRRPAEQSAANPSPKKPRSFVAQNAEDSIERVPRSQSLIKMRLEKTPLTDKDEIIDTDADAPVAENADDIERFPGSRSLEKMRLEKTPLTDTDEIIDADAYKPRIVVELEFGKIMSHLKSTSYSTRPDNHIKRANTLISNLIKSLQNGDKHSTKRRESGRRP